MTHPVQPSSTSSVSSRERCPQCGLLFPDVSSLIDHASSHSPPPKKVRNDAGIMDADRGRGGGSGREICGVCGKSFDDLIALIAHAGKHGVSLSALVIMQID